MTETLSRLIRSARAAVIDEMVPTRRKREILDVESVFFVHRGQSFVDSSPSLLTWRGAARHDVSHSGKIA